MATKAVSKKSAVPKKYVTSGRGERVYCTLDKRRLDQLQQIIKMFGGDNSSAVSDCIARRHVELKKEFPNEFD